MNARERLVVQCIFFLCGISAGVLTPPLQPPDEPVHFLRAYSIGHGGFTDRSGRDYLPRAIVDFAETATGGIRHRPELEYPPELLSDAWQLRIDDDESLAAFGAAALYPPINHLGPAIAMVVVEPFAPRPLALMYLGRLVNLLIGTLLLGVSLRMSDSLAPTLAVLALFPTVVTQMASLSADAITLSLGFLLVAWVAQQLENSEVADNKKLAGYFLLAIGVSLTKLGYWLLPWAILVVPAARWGHPQQRWKWLGGFAVVQVAMSSFWLAGVTGFPLPAGVDPRVQLEQLVTNPFLGLSVAWQTLSLYWGSVLSQVVGHLGSLDTRLPASFKVLSLVLLALSPLLARRAYRLSGAQIAGLAAICAGTLAIIGGALYVTFTPVGNAWVIGLVGRYLIPLVPLAAMVGVSVLQPIGARVFEPAARDRILRTGVPAYGVLSGAVTATALLMRYWI